MIRNQLSQADHLGIHFIMLYPLHQYDATIGACRDQSIDPCLPVVIQIHGSGTETYYKSIMKKYLFNMWCLAPASAIAVLTPWCASLVTRNNLHNLVHVVPNALNNKLTDIANNQRIPVPAKKYITILAMSRLVQGKGFGLIIDALPYLPHGIIIEIAGSGPLQSKLEKRIVELGQSKKVRFLGWLNEQDKAAAFSRADVFCLPSQYDSFAMGWSLHSPPYKRHRPE
jgi:glycosyltransferase involved in cell wall biosynthesis